MRRACETREGRRLNPNLLADDLRGAAIVTVMQMPADPLCPLCGRPIPKAAKQSIHHLTPKLKGGAKGPTVLLHEVCHRAIHANLTEVEIARDFATVDALRAHPSIAKFIEWIRKKDPAFHARTAGPRRKR